LIFYTGKQPLNPVLLELNSNVKVFKRRPDLTEIIPNIIHGIESETVLPGDSQPCGKCQVIRVLLGRLNELDKDKDTSEEEKFMNMTVFAQELGFHFVDLFNHLEGLERDNGDTDQDALRDAFLRKQVSVGSFRPASDLEEEVRPESHAFTL